MQALLELGAWLLLDVMVCAWWAWACRATLEDRMREES
jgi:hypothetical protein